MRKRTLFAVAAVTILALGLGLPGLSLGGQAAAQTATPPPSATNLSALDVIFVVDQSGSMFLWSDPQGAPCLDAEGHVKIGANGYPEICDPTYPRPMRQSAAQYFIDYLGVEPPEGLRAGVVYFGADAQVIVPLFNEGDKAAREQAIQALERLPDDKDASPYWWWTDTNRAFEVVSSQLEEGREPVIIFLSDGHPEIEEWEDQDCSVREDYYQAHKEFVSRFKEQRIKFFTVIIALTDYVKEQDECLEQDAELQSYENIWRHLAAETGGWYYRVQEQADPEARRAEMRAIFHSILANIRLASPGSGGGGQKRENETVVIPVEFGECRKLVVEIDRPSPQTQIVLTGPGGEAYEPEVSRDEYVMYGITDAEPGDWKLTMEGGSGSYQYRLDCTEAELACTFLAPAGQHPQCKEMTIVAKLASQEGEAVTDGWVDVVATLPDGSVKNLSLQHQGDGVYQGVFQDTQQQGDYKLELRGQDREREKPLAKAEQVIAVLPLLHLGFVEPVPGGSYSGGDVPIQAALKTGCASVQNDPTLSGKATSIQASLTGANGQVLGPVALTDDGQAADKQSLDGIFSGLLTGVGEGDYTLTIDLVNEQHGARDTISGPVRFGPAPAPTAVPPPTVPPPPPTPALAVVSLEAPDLGRQRVGETVEVALVVNGEALTEEQTISVAVVDLPCTLEDRAIRAQPGQAKQKATVRMTIPENVATGQKYEGKLRLGYPNGETRELSVSFEALPPPISPLIPLAIALGVVAVAITALVVYRRQSGKGQLTGKIVYVSTPPGMGSMPDEELVGEKYRIPLDETPDAMAPSPATAYAAGSEAVPAPTEGEFSVDYTWEEPAGKAPEGLHTELLFTARRKQTEALLTVVKTNGQVLVSDVPVGQGGPPHRLSDGDTISVGRYTLRYESLMAAGGEEDLPVQPWGEDTGADSEFGEGSWDDYGGSGSDPGTSGTDTSWDDYR